MNNIFRCTTIYMKKLFRKTIIIVSVLGALCTASFAYASTMSVVTDTSTVKTGGLFTARVLFDTENTPINAVEGSLVYSPDVIKIEKISIGSSVVSFWVEQPKVSNQGTVHFSGIIPGGIVVSEGELFSVTARAVSVGDARMSIEGAQSLINDGHGSIEETKTIASTVKIKQGNASDYQELARTDTTKPLSFTIVRTRDMSLYDNNHFIVFSSQDKGSGVDHYVVCEFLRACVTTSSPYELANQTPLYRIVVHAYDAQSNVQTAKLVSPGFVLVISVMGILVLVLVRYVYARYFNRHAV